jgi:hypothetical protein
VHEGRILSEMPIAPALARDTEAHLAQAAQQRETNPAVNEQAPAPMRV